MTSLTPRPPRHNRLPDLRRLPGLRRLLDRSRPLDRDRLLGRLPTLEYRQTSEEERLFDQASLARGLLVMLGVDQDSEYRLCREVAEHALGSVPDPAEIGL